MPDLPTPKQPLGERRKDWYPYYAGFTNSFAQAVINHFLPKATSVLDPWSGSGTTVNVAAALGRSATGLDVNPALTVVARARNCPITLTNSLDALGAELLRAMTHESELLNRSDPLLTWLRAPAVVQVRQLQRAIHIVLIDDRSLASELEAGRAEAIDDLPLLASFFYAALFAVARDLLASFRGSNPAWLRSPASPSHRLNPSLATLSTTFGSRVRYLKQRLTLTSPVASSRARLGTQNLLDWSSAQKFDGCLTSPPYGTRIDYVKGSLPELAILGLSADATANLRRLATGTPVVRGIRRPAAELQSSEAFRTLSAVAKHPTHGSANYYRPWLANYLIDLQRSCHKICRAIKKQGRICVLVQDSYYKAVHIDLQQIVTETFEANGRPLLERVDFTVPRSFATINPSARRHLSERRNLESLLAFE